MMMRSIDEQIIDRLFVEQVLNGLIWLCLVHNFFFFPAIVVLNLFVFSSKSVRFLIICCCRAFVGTNDFVFNTTIIKKKQFPNFDLGLEKKHTKETQNTRTKTKKNMERETRTKNKKKNLNQNGPLCNFAIMFLHINIYFCFLHSKETTLNNNNHN